jgi:hypothetical protein
MAIGFFGISGGVVNFNKLMLYSTLGGNVRCDSRCAKSLTGMVAARQVSNAHFAGVVRLRLRDFSSNEGISACGNRSLKIGLSAARTPSYIFNSLVSTSHMSYSSITISR